MTAKILLYDLVQPALIVPAPTGIIYQNQTAGIYCHQQELEGFLIPIMLAFFPEEKQRQLINAVGLTKNQADDLDYFWSHHDLNIPFWIDRARLEDSEEAWIWVLNKSEYFGGSAILTWDNSD